MVPPPVALSPLLPPLMFAVGASSVVAIVVLVCVVAVWVVVGTAVYGFAIEVSVVAVVFTELDLGTAVVYVQSAVSIVRHLSFLLVSL